MDAWTVALVGEVDAHTAAVLVGVWGVPPSGRGDLVADMAGVTFVDSSGLRAILELSERAHGMGRRLVLRAPSVAVVRLLEITGLDLVPVCDEWVLRR